MIEKWKSLGWRLVGNNPRKLGDPRRVIYFSVIVVLFGNLGTWIALGQYLLGERSATGAVVLGNFATYFIAIAFTASADHTLRGEKDRTVSFIYYSAALVSATAGSCVLAVNNNIFIGICTFVGALVALLLWLCVSTSNPDHDDSDAIDALGGRIP